MTDTDDDDALTGKRICHACIGEAYLSAEVQSSGEEAECDYCGATAQSISIKDLAERIEKAFTDHYTRTATEPDSWQERLMADRESSYDWVRDGTPVAEAIQDVACIDKEPATDVLEILAEKHALYPDKDNLGEESEFDADSYYDEKGPDNQAWHEEWRNFEHSLKTEARFFSRSAADHLAQVFGGIDKLKTRDSRPLVVDAGPGTALDHLSRARVFQSEVKLIEALRRPDTHLGSPPPSIARAGRMNAQGISVFYGADDASVAIAEVRPCVGSRVAVANFDITRPLRLLDLTALEDAHDMGSIFDPSLKRRLERVAFLRTLGGRMARPVMPDDEAIDYLPTQAVADFLATTNEPRLDGIIFPSAQVEHGRNVVLFHHAARVDGLSLPEGTVIEASAGYGTEDGWETDYSVSERVPAKSAGKAKPRGEDLLGMWLPYDEPLDPNADYRDASLRIVPDCVAVHDAISVAIKTVAHPVRRYRSEKRKPKY